MASVTKSTRSSFWWARYRDSAGNEFTRSTKQKTKAKALEVAFQMERIARGVLNCVDVDKISRRREISAFGPLPIHRESISTPNMVG